MKLLSIVVFAPLVVIAGLLASCNTDSTDPLGSCGDGIVQEHELCDTAIALGYCPAGWGACASCARGCQNRKYDLGLECPIDGNDFQFNERAQSVLTRTYDESGVLNFESIREFNAQYRLTRLRLMFRSRNEETRFSYDDDGRPNGRWYDADLDGLPDQLWTIEYHEDGASIVSYDADADGIVDRLDYTLKNEFGQTLFNWVDTDLTTEAFDESTRYVYDAEGVRQRLELDRDGDNQPDMIQTWSTDDALRTSTANTDRDGDGVVDEQSITRFDDRGRRMDTTSYEGLASAGGTVKAKTWYTYDDASNSITLRSDGDGDGRADYVFVIERNAHGDDTFVAEDFDADGVYDRQSTFMYDDLGNVIATREEVLEPASTQLTAAVFDERNIPMSYTRSLDGVEVSRSDFSCNALMYDVLPMRLPRAPGFQSLPVLSGTPF